MQNIEVEIEGITPYMQHRFPESAVMGLLGSKDSKKKNEEKRTPREIAEEHSYKTQDGVYYVPPEQLIGAIKTVASDYKQQNSARKSLKLLIAGVIQVVDDASLLYDDKAKPVKDFEVDIMTAVNHQKGRVAVCRPRFDKWRTRFQLLIDDSVVSAKTVHEMLEDAGRRSGIGSYRVARGGRFGKFHVTKWKEVKTPKI